MGDLAQIGKYLGKLKLICEYASTEKLIKGSLKEFMFLDSLHLLKEILRLLLAE